MLVLLSSVGYVFWCFGSSAHLAFSSETGVGWLGLVLVANQEEAFRFYDDMTATNSGRACFERGCVYRYIFLQLEGLVGSFMF